MRRILAVVLTISALSLSGATVANATTGPNLSSVPVATSTTLAQEETQENAGDDGDNTGLWGLAGLLGLLGLLGLKRRNDVDRRVGPAAAPGRRANPGV